jgi:hypothetical protein
MNDRGKELFSEILELCNGVDSIEAITALVNVLGLVIANAATPDRVQALTADVIKVLETSRKRKPRARRHPASSADADQLTGTREPLPWPYPRVIAVRASEVALTSKYRL